MIKFSHIVVESGLDFLKTKGIELYICVEVQYCMFDILYASVLNCICHVDVAIVRASHH